MAQAKGIQAHKVFKLGKAPAKRDTRNLMFASILRAKVKVPKEYDFDLKHPGIPTPMFGNDEYGDCVIAGRAHQTLRFELIEQNSKIGIPDRLAAGHHHPSAPGVSVLALRSRRRGGRSDEVGVRLRCRA